MLRLYFIHLRLCFGRGLCDAVVYPRLGSDGWRREFAGGDGSCAFRWCHWPRISNEVLKKRSGLLILMGELIWATPMHPSAMGSKGEPFADVERR